MKVIDLLNKKYNNEEMPKHILINRMNYIYDDYSNKYIDETMSGMTIDFTNNVLNMPVEIIEDNTIDRNAYMDKIIKVFEDIGMCLDRLSVKMSSTGQGSIDNYVDRYKYDLQAVKQLNKEIKELKERL